MLFHEAVEDGNPAACNGSALRIFRPVIPGTEFAELETVPGSDRSFKRNGYILSCRNRGVPSQPQVEKACFQSECRKRLPTLLVGTLKGVPPSVSVR